MNTVVRLYNENVQSQVFTTTNNLGLKIYVIPNSMASEVRVNIVVNYGGEDKLYKDNKTGKIKQIPDGIAHYMEHLMFYEKNRSEQEIFDIFEKLDAETNAFTYIDKTIYSLVTSEEYINPLRKLMKLVFVPYFDERTLNKERKIVSSEIEITPDSPSILSLLNQKGKDLSVIGTKENLTKVTVEDMYNIYENYYTLNNMAMVIYGPVEPIEVFEEVEDMLKKLKLTKKTKVVKKEVKKRISNKRLLVKEEDRNFDSQLQLGLKIQKINPKEIVKFKTAMTIFSLINLSTMSDFVNDLIDTRKLNSIISCDYLEKENLMIFIANTKNAFEVKDELIKYLKTLSVDDMLEEDFEIAKRAIYKDDFLDYNSVIEDIVIDSFINDTNLFEDVDALSDMTFSEYKEFVKKILNFKDDIYMYCRK